MTARKRAGVILMITGAMLLAAALLLLYRNRREDLAAGKASEETLAALQTACEETDASGGEKTVEIGGYEYLGYLSIPALKLRLPVLSEWDDARLKIAPCRYYGSVETEDLVICGHNYTSHFGRLKALKPGDLVQFTDLNGNVTTYRVEDIETLGPNQVKEMIGSGYELTLYTCTYGGRSRITVRCRKGGEETCQK